MIVYGAGLYAIGGGVLTLLGWWLNVKALTDWRNDGISMLVNTAVCSVLAGASLLLGRKATPTWRVMAARIAATAVATIGGLTVLEHLTGWSLGIDTLVLDRDWGQFATTASMRMGLPACTSFLILGVALYLATLDARSRRVTSLLAIGPMAITSLSLTGYWFGANQLFGVAKFTAIAWQSSTILAALAVGTAAAAAESGPFASLRRRGVGGSVLRRLLVPVIVIPFSLAWLRIWAERTGLMDGAFGTAFFTLVEVAFFVGLLWWTSKNIGEYATEARLAQSRLASIVETTDDAVFSQSIDGTIISWNAAAERLFGYSAKEAVGQSILLIVPPDRVDEAAMILEKMHAGEQIDAFDTVRVGRDSLPRHISLTVSPIRNTAGAIVGASKIARDVSARRQTESALRRSEEELQSLTDAIPQLAWAAHPDGRVFWFNQGWFEFAGATYDEMEGWEWQSIHSPETLGPFMEKWRQAIASGKSFEMESSLRARNGSYRWFLCRARPLVDDEGRVQRWFGTYTDIDRTKRVEFELREQAQTLELLSETAAVVGSRLDLDGLIQEVTDIATKLSRAKFGAFFYSTVGEDGESYLLYSLSGAPREAFEKFGNPRKTPVFAPTFNGEGPIRSGDILADARYGKMAPHFGMPKGHLPVRSYLAAPVTSPSGEVIGGLFFGHPDTDVFTEQDEKLIQGVASQAAIAIDNARLYEGLQRAAKERLELLEAERSARTEAERMNLLKDEFLATLSHELRTPLSAILGWTYLLDAETSERDEIRDGLETIERSAKAQTQLVEDLLDMSRIVSGKVQLEIKNVAVADIVDSAVQSVIHSARAKQLRFTADTGPPGLTIAGDSTRLQQVIWNLLSNAIKFTPEGGEVRASVDRVDSHVRIAVSDTGIGVPKEFAAFAFDRFRQADATATRRYGGLGIGLSIVKSLVELHGGAVSVVSEGADRGSEFTVTLPIVQTPDSTPRAASESHLQNRDRDHAKSLAGVQVLLVEDDSDTRRTLQRVLTNSGATVTAVSDATQALMSLGENQFSVIVSDIGMPDVDGYQFIKLVRDLPPASGGKTPAIALTAFARSEDRDRALQMGYDAHLAKPIEARELVQAILELRREGITSEIA
ncbi:Sensory/regulatory protein RpfC [Botrimarina colliarenosi]|uniref:histidine kinase n=1 Tax=Botrimarina colliarenosi TaxID=2528001 RepID=A0A5C6AHH2_9BACT|nr:PAS domain S-box protein [Botrimarina colliarenosi]TWT99444.1 Sensory/regulatory protein RpfC [Botrimarina colliarenosi]